MVLISVSSALISQFSFPSRQKPLAASPTVPPTKEPSQRFQLPSRTLRPAPLRTLKCLCRRQSTEEFERLFSNLNQVTMKREPGSVTSAIFLVAGTTVGAGILAIPAVTQEAGFLASAITCILCWIYMVIAHYRLGNLSEPSFNSQQVIGAINGCLVFGIIVSFTSLVGVASGDLHWNSLLQAHVEAIPQSIPIIALAFVYQNVVPVLCTNLEGNLSKVRTAIVLGTAVPLVLFLIWDAVILGTIPNLSTSSGDVSDPLELLRSNNGIVGPIVEVFSFLAIATSYIGFVLGLSDFVSDLLKLPSGQNKPLPYLLTLVPPLVLSLLDPEIFFKALDFAGTYGVLVLFGVIPAAMSWSERYSDASQSPTLPPLVPGGKLTLSIVLGGALVVIFSEIYKDVINR